MIHEVFSYLFSMLFLSLKTILFIQAEHQKMTAYLLVRCALYIVYLIGTSYLLVQHFSSESALDILRKDYSGREHRLHTDH